MAAGLRAFVDASAERRDGVGGFFQRSFVEVEARSAATDRPVERRSDRATAEGLSTPGIQALGLTSLPTGRLRRHSAVWSGQPA